MGGDHAPAQPVAGAILAARELGVPIRLVGRRPDIEAELARHRIMRRTEKILLQIFR